MATHEMRKEFQRRIKNDIDPVEHSERVKQSILRHKYENSQNLKETRGVKKEDGWQK